MKVLYYLGRLLQLAGLMILPSAIWIGQFGHNEHASILVFVSSVLIFYLGWFLTRV